MTLSFQLYSARNFLPWTKIIPRLSELGYTQVEGFGGVYANASEFRDLLDSSGMTMPSGHFFPLGELEEGLDASLAAARKLGIKRVICPAPEDLWRQGTDAANWVSLAKRLNEAGKRVNDAGFRFAWHNHHWEFMQLPSGELPMDLLCSMRPTLNGKWMLPGLCVLVRIRLPGLKPMPNASPLRTLKTLRLMGKTQTRMAGLMWARA